MTKVFWTRHSFIKQKMPGSYKFDPLNWESFIDAWNRTLIINDSLGHTAGDHLLVLLATRLSSLIRDGDTVARLGGDEFMIILEDFKAPEDVHTLAEKVLKSLEQAFDIRDQELVVSASIGISVYPEDGSTVDNLVRNSDSAMYQAKAKGRNNSSFIPAN